MTTVTLHDCPPGLFLFEQTLALKSEYKTESLSRPGSWQSDAYLIESGEYFWGATSDPVAREQLLVTPLDPYRCAKCHEIFLAAENQH